MKCYWLMDLGRHFAGTTFSIFSIRRKASPAKATAIPLDLANVIKPLDGNPQLETNGAISGANPILIEISRPISIPFLFQVAGMLKPKKCEGIDHIIGFKRNYATRLIPRIL